MTTDERAAILALLRAFEWSRDVPDNDDDATPTPAVGRCPVCREPQFYGHLGECELARAIAVLGAKPETETEATRG